MINGFSIGNKNTGVQYYSKYLYENLKNVSNIELLTFKNRFFRNSVSRILFENFLLTNVIRKNNAVYHATNYVVPFFFKQKYILTVHDLITIDFPKLCKNTSVIYFKLLFKSSIQNAEKIITVSETVKKDIVKHFEINESKITVIPLGVNPLFKKRIDYSLRKYHLPEKYILFVGNLEAKKNLENTIKAFYKFKTETGFSHKFILVGKRGWKVFGLEKLIDSLGLKKEIIFLGYVPIEDLVSIYSFADIFVFPSFYEGFGIPPLEAMACETPVLISNQGASPEICKNAALKVSPFEVNEIADGIKELITNEKLRSCLVEKGKKMVKDYTWEKTALKTLKVYEEVANS